MKAKTYHEWFLRHQEYLTAELARKHSKSEVESGEGASLSVEVVPYSHLKNYILSGESQPDILIACDDDGHLTDYAVQLICDFFLENPRINMVYGDEDQVADGAFVNPWFKADWSPDTFLSTFYFGSIFAIRSSTLGLINPGKRTAQEFESESRILEDAVEEQEARRNEPDTALRSWIYGKLCLKVAQADGGFSRRRGEELPVGHIAEILFHADKKQEPWDADLIRDSLTGRYSAESATTRLISIIIPSKDNPALLERCVRSIIQHAHVPFELIIVDNGSSEENRARTQALVDEINNGDMAASYIYKKMPFNMAGMNNLGAAAANGEMLLFLHDDVEIRKSGWLSHLSEKAKLPYVGAVGMKLLYPDSNLIQHAGIMSVEDGPVYKLQYKSNGEVWYHGFNKGVRNVLALSGACIMVRRDVFTEAGGFDEQNFPDVFTNVDFCYRVYENGYYNVVRNNMYLYYFDPVSEENLETLEQREKNRPAELEALDRLHPGRRGNDPFYHRYLARESSEVRFVPSLELEE
ncbi:MAG: glycosyltransferase [Sarcina sp.]|nr:glycosyltransferase [Sarcina sp.]